MAIAKQIVNPANVNDVYDLAHGGQGLGTCETSSGTALAVTLAGYNAVQTGYVAVRFKYSVPASATLNINGKGTYPIRRDGVAITANTIPAGATALFLFDGTYYHLITVGNASYIDDTDLVHKSGAETITGAKTFDGSVMIGQQSSLQFMTDTDEGVYVEADRTSTVKELIFASIEDDSAVTLSNIAAPTQDSHAANKKYIDDIVGDIETLLAAI